MKGLTFVLALVGWAAFAAPPPPPPPGWHPPGVPKELGGYELRPIYLDYRDWIDNGRGRALRLAVDYEPRWQGKQHWGDLIRSEIEDYDHGAVRVDRLEPLLRGRLAQERTARKLHLPLPLRDSSRPQHAAAPAAHPGKLQAGGARQASGRA